ncbi:hypothetical protein RhiirC2_781374 [Rhizophagus irregularis]|uniref:Uncharacterized protein n=1 Tax=Rhizophagus irregularis TaxID=588596 RepID=A0A2N1N5F2_9GLOM|nr:hypothetical protein RhiirC2_781374 [Rhizophagus irregularis]
MIERARQPYFPIQKREDTRHNILYNDVITLLRNMDGLKVVERLVALLWYIDPRREKLIARSLQLPDIFNDIYLGTINYIWKVPLRSDHRSETENARVITAINENLSKYYTRQMRKKCFKKAKTNAILQFPSSIKKDTPAVLRTLYFNLTGDAYK